MIPVVLSPSTFFLPILSKEFHSVPFYSILIHSISFHTNRLSHHIQFHFIFFSNYIHSFHFIAIFSLLFLSVPKTAPESVIGNNVTAYSIWVKWSGLPLQPAGILRQWAIYYRVWNASEDTTSNFAVPVHQRNIVIGGLELFTLYCVQVLK